MAIKSVEGLEVSVGKTDDPINCWTVEAIAIKGDGEIYQAIFVGPDAEALAVEYARAKYGFTGVDN